jgi:hypothetical protein
LASRPSRLAPLFVYAIGAAVLTWPLPIRLTTHLGALQDAGDPFLNLWILGWGLRAWTTNPVSVFDGRVFDANIFHPAEGTLAYSDHFLLQALAMAPLYGVTGDVVLCYNVLLLLSIALSGWAMHVLVRAVTGSTTGAYVAGLAWACWPFRTAHLLHIQLQALYFMPLALLCLHRLAAGRRWRDAVALAAVVTLQLVASVYHGLLTGVMAVVAGATLAVSTGQWRSRALWLRLAGAAVLSGALAVPVLVPYVRSQQTEGFGRTLVEAANHSASWQAYSQVPPVNLLYGRTGWLAPRDPAMGARDRRHVEHQLFPGLVLVVLAGVGALYGARRDSRVLVAVGLALAAVGVLLSFGPEGVRPLYAALHDHVYGFQAVRAPARFAVVAVLGLCLLASLGMRALAAARWRAVRVVLVAALCFEYLNAPLPLAAAPPRHTAVGDWLAQEPAPGAVVHLPLTVDIENTPFMVQSLEHGRPIVNGYSGQRPAFFSSLVENLADFPSATALAALRDIDVRFVVSPTPVAGVGDARSPLVERARVAGGVIYELRWTPESVAALVDTRTEPPPPPGPVPFAAGETAEYAVYWDGGPLNLVAGTATLSVARPRPDGWQFDVHAETADWLATFFRANDRFTTTTDAMLLPLEHRRAIREGRRQLDRTYLYDRDARHLRIGASPDAARSADALTLPLAPDARDAVSALFYVRTLPLAPGSIVTLPLNEAGTSLVLNVASAERETITAEERSQVALRIEPRLMRRIERRRPLAMTVWLSTDARRVPLRVVVEAGFGRVRLELARYRP